MATGASFLVQKLNQLAALPGISLGNFSIPAAAHRLENGLPHVKLPFTKFPRNPTNP